MKKNLLLVSAVVGTTIGHTHTTISATIGVLIALFGFALFSFIAGMNSIRDKTYSSCKESEEGTVSRWHPCKKGRQLASES